MKAEIAEQRSFKNKFPSKEEIRELNYHINLYVEKKGKFHSKSNFKEFKKALLKDLRETKKVFLTCLTSFIKERNDFPKEEWEGLDVTVIFEKYNKNWKDFVEKQQRASLKPELFEEVILEMIKREKSNITKSNKDGKAKTQRAKRQNSTSNKRKS